MGGTSYAVIMPSDDDNLHTFGNKQDYHQWFNVVPNRPRVTLPCYHLKAPNSYYTRTIIKSLPVCYH